MGRRNSNWTPPAEIDLLIKNSHPNAVLSHYGYPLPGRIGGNNLRMKCPVESCDSENSSYGQLSIELSPPYRIKCFSCSVRGKLFELMWILKHLSPPSDGKVRGEEFKEMLADLKEINADSENDTKNTTPISQKKSRRESNCPMAQSPNERVRLQQDLWKRGVDDAKDMPPVASRYFRRRPFLSPEVCQKWGVAYISDTSTLRKRIVYRIDDVQGRTLAYAGRDPDFEIKHSQWLQSKRGKEPIKTRFPSDEYFRRGLELYGQQRQRLDNEEARCQIRESGIWLVEGFNDVINLDFLGQLSVGAMSNRLTDVQIEKLARFVEATRAPGIVIGFDRDVQGTQGQMETVSRLARHIPVLDLWGGYEGSATEPEQLTQIEVNHAQNWLKSRFKLV